MLTVKRKIFIKDVVFGVILLLDGIIAMALEADLISDYFVIVALGLVLMMVVVLIYLWIKSRQGLIEDEDEIDMGNYNQATVLMSKSMMIILLGLSLVVKYFDIEILFNSSSLFVCIGVFSIGEYLIYRKIDKDNFETDYEEI